MNWRNKGEQNTSSNKTTLNHKQLSETEAFDKELEMQQNKKINIPSPFDIAVEDKVESSYEFIGRKFKQGVKQMKKIDKKIQNWANGVKNEEKFLEREDELKAESESNNIDSFIGGNMKLKTVNIDPNKKISLDVEEIKNNLKKDKPIKFNIKTKKAFLEQKKKEEIINPFEADNNDFKFPELSKSTPIQKSTPSKQNIDTPFLDEFMNDDDNKYIFGTSSMSQSRVKIFDDDDDCSIFPSNSFKRTNFNHPSNNGFNIQNRNNKNNINGNFSKVMNNDFLNFDKPKLTKNNNKDPFESVFE